MATDSRPGSRPGVVKPRRFRPRFHWELLVCGVRGHELIGTDAAELRAEDAAFAREMRGQRWHRCVRCDSWLPFPPPRDPERRYPPSRREIELPLRGRPLRDKILLRLIAINRAAHFVVLGALAVAVLLVASHEGDLRDLFYAILGAIHGVFGGPTTETGGSFVHRIDELLSLPSGELHLIGVALVVYAVVEGVEAVGLWMQKRWAEYLTLLVTASLLPLELYELAKGVTVLKVVALVVNLAIVLYLLFAKRLFGLRGGAAADEALRERDLGWASLERTSPEAYSAA
ncbi:MAG: DUF2127 domain-containing protein [Thermoleophilaceae bacterium]|nr:DUF2127 domain-containing protein [Thermoleophilaceae bacterium]